MCRYGKFYKCLIVWQVTVQICKSQKKNLTFNFLLRTFLFCTKRTSLRLNFSAMTKADRERETRCQFQQCFMHNFYAGRSQKRSKIKLSHRYLFTLSGSASVKAVHRTLMKLNLGVNFTNILCSTFIRKDTKSTKTVFFLFLGCKSFA